MNEFIYTKPASYIKELRTSVRPDKGILDIGSPIKTEGQVSTLLNYCIKISKGSANNLYIGIESNGDFYVFRHIFSPDSDYFYSGNVRFVLEEGDRLLIRFDGVVSSRDLELYAYEINGFYGN